MRKLFLAILTVFLLFLAGCDLLANSNTRYALFPNNPVRISGGKTALQSLIDSCEALSEGTLAK